jgi:hypothetical protein
MIDPKALEAAARALAGALFTNIEADVRSRDMTDVEITALMEAALTAYHKHLADNGSIVISVEWLEAVLAYASPIGVMGDHTFAEIRAMLAAHEGN